MCLLHVLQVESAAGMSESETEVDSPGIKLEIDVAVDPSFPPETERQSAGEIWDRAAKYCWDLFS